MFSPVGTEASVKMQEMNILHDLLALLNPKSSCTPKIANVIAEVAKNGETDTVLAPRGGHGYSGAHWLTLEG